MSTETPAQPAPPTPDPVPAPVVTTATPDRVAIPELVKQALTDVSALVRLEIELARSELSDAAKQGVAGAALFIVAAGLALMAWLLASFGAVYGLAEVLPVWASFLVVAGAYLLIGVVLVLVGRARLTKVRGPERAQHQLELTKQALRPSP